jgi:diketogulonate reductase-like aldo/keto reductase
MELTLRNGGTIPQLGMGTWFLGEGRRSSAEEEAALLAGIDAGLSLIDTAEMYGSGKAEELIGRVLPLRARERLFLVSKVYPHNAGRDRIFRSCEDSLRRMHTDYLDLYLLHWRGKVPLQETISGMQELVQQGKIRHWGVSNFDLEDMQELFRCYQGDQCVVNQVLYHLGSRGIEVALRPWQEAHGVVTMAYCPLAQAGLLRSGMVDHPVVIRCARELDLTPMQVLLGFVLHQKNTVAIPRTGSQAHMALNAAMADRVLPQEVVDQLTAAFPAPTCRVPLDME